MTNTILKYGLSVYDLRRAGRLGGENAPPWENKSMWIFYIELVTGKIHHSRFQMLFLTEECSRFLQVVNLPCILLCHYRFLRPASQHRARRLCYCQIFHHTSESTSPLPDGHPKYGSAVSQCDRRRTRCNE